MAKRKPKKQKTLRELNASLSENYDQLVEFARRSSIRLIGKPTVGAAKRRKSA